MNEQSICSIPKFGLHESKSTSAIMEIHLYKTAVYLNYFTR